MITTQNLTVRFGSQTLFENVNIKFVPGHCYGVIGANGAGKSTLLRVIAGDIEPTSGEVHIQKGMRIAVLKQDHFAYDAYPVIDTVIMGHKRLYDVMKEKEALYAKPDFTDEDGMKVSELETEFAELDGWQAESQAATLLSDLGIEDEKHYELMSELSGSEKVRVLLAQALFGNPDILYKIADDVQRPSASAILCYVFALYKCLWPKVYLPALDRRAPGCYHILRQ